MHREGMHIGRYIPKDLAGRELDVNQTLEEIGLGEIMFNSERKHLSTKSVYSKAPEEDHKEVEGKRKKRERSRTKTSTKHLKKRSGTLQKHKKTKSKP